MLGRCLLRLQQYERLLKALLVDSEIILGDPGSFESERATRGAKYANMTLGTLVKSLMAEVVVPDADGPELLTNEDANAPCQGPSFVSRSRFSPIEPGWDTMRSGLKELVELRNDLVHHLIERFDIGKDAGCVAALVHLQDCNARIDQRLDELLGIADHMTQVRKEFHAFLASDPGIDLLVNGIRPDGMVDWPRSRVVSLLREAAQALKEVDGWAPLTAACARIASVAPSLTPARHGCSTWPQVLHESRLFDLTYRADQLGQKSAWYREREAR